MNSPSRHSASPRGPRRRTARAVRSFLGLLIGVSLLAAIITVGTLAVFTARGDRVLIVTSGSMEPRFQAGDTVLIRPMLEQDFAVGQVVTFRPQGASDRLTTHRIVAVHPREEGLFLQTKGDANAAPDPDFVPAGSVLGVMTGSAEYLGRWLAFYQSPVGRLVVLGIPLLLLFLAQVWDMTAWCIRRQQRRRIALAAHAKAEGIDAVGARTPIDVSDLIFGSASSTPEPMLGEARPQVSMMQPASRTSVPSVPEPEPVASRLAVLVSGTTVLALAISAGTAFAYLTAALFTNPASASGNTFSTASSWACTPTYSAAVLADSPTHYYRLAESPITAGTTVATSTAPGALTGTYRRNGAAGAGFTAAQPSSLPCDTNTSVRFDGASTYVSANANVTNPQVFSVEARFKTTGSAAGGKIVGFGNNGTGSSASYDRHIFMNNAGRLVFGVYPGAVRVVVSPASYNDNQWHHVVATLSSAGMRLYVDGVLVASDPAITSAQVYNGRWRIGWDNLGGWGANTPTNSYFTGFIDEVAIYNSALTATQVTAHFNGT
ncbi:MAG: signal peptidase I [Actinomycetota bacterium]